VQPRRDLPYGVRDEHVVDAVGMIERLAQGRARLGVELQRAIAALQIEVEQRHAAFAAGGDMPGEVGGDRRGADAAAHAEHRDQLAGARRRISRTAVEDRPEGAVDQRHHERLEEILRDADRFEVAVQDDVVAVADDDNLEAGRRFLGKPPQRQHRIGEPAHVDDDEARRGAARQLFDRPVDAAVHDLPVDHPDIGQTAAHQVFGITVEQIGEHGRRRLRRVDAREGAAQNRNPSPLNSAAQASAAAPS
jgi:hypothetical protein